MTSTAEATRKTVKAARKKVRRMTKEKKAIWLKWKTDMSINYYKDVFSSEYRIINSYVLQQLIL